MTHLLIVSLGPVQDFINAARRTRDLWAGSRLLSDVSRAAASEIREHGTLIFPSSIAFDSIGNVILAEIREGQDPASAATHAKNAAQAAWRKAANDALHQAADCVNLSIWEDQVADAIEFYAAWTPVDPDYQTAQRRVRRLLDGRKACRDFIPAKGNNLLDLPREFW
jgi:CRISPR-associated protein Cmr2